MADKRRSVSAGWRQGPDGRWYSPLTGSAGPDREPANHDDVPFAELAELINSGDVSRDIDNLVDDPELAV